LPGTPGHTGAARHPTPPEVILEVAQPLQLRHRLSRFIDEVLALNGRLGEMSDDMPLLGAVAELDSVGAVALLTGLEDHFGIQVEDDEISADTFATFGALVDYVGAKLG
jgi:acyl carrier protein